MTQLKTPRTLLLALLSLCLALLTQTANTAKAADMSKFSPGRIIDDSVFYNKNTMTAADIQAFLNSKVPICETDGHTSTHAKAPCLKDYHETTRTIPADSFCNGYTGASDQTAAEIIFNVAQSCGINPQAIIVILQKEQGLVTDTWPRDGWLVWGCQPGGGCVNTQYRSAMGYGCPDTALCDSTYYGFFNQVFYASRQYKRYQASPYSYTYVSGRHNNIPWNPDTISCGYSSVFLENQATAGLYNYTPYRPNNAALAGSRDYCASFGNRNFYATFTDWFGSTYGDTWQDMDIPRYLLVKQDAHKVNPLTMAEIDNQYVTKNMLVEFASKTYLEDGTLCLRTIANTTTNSNMCIKYTYLEETNWESLDIPRLLAANKQGRAINPTTNQPATTTFNKDQVFNFTSKTFTSNGRLCLRDHDDTLLGSPTCILYDDLYEMPTTADFSYMAIPRSLTTNAKITKINILTGEKTEPLPSDMVIPFAMRLDFGDRLCLRTQADTNLGKPTCILYDDLYEMPTTADFSYMAIPRSLTTNAKITKINILTGEKTEPLPSDMVIPFAMRLDFKKQLCLRTVADTNLGKPTCILYTDLRELP